MKPSEDCKAEDVPEVSEAQLFAVQDRVRIHGLLAKPELNGRVGLCEARQEDTARWLVKLADGATVAVKSENLVRHTGIGLWSGPPARLELHGGHYQLDPPPASPPRTSTCAVQTDPLPKQAVKKPPAKKTATLGTQTEDAKGQPAAGGKPAENEEPEFVGIPRPSLNVAPDMVYVECHMCGTTLEMVVDTASQITAVSEPLMRQLKLEKQLDKSMSGTAHGAGSTRILGMIRNVPMKIGAVPLAVDLNVLSIDVPMLLLGMDQMRRYRFIVDLDAETLIIGRDGGKGGVKVPFMKKAQGLGAPGSFKGKGKGKGKDPLGSIF